jgi:uncharacterized protein
VLHALDRLRRPEFRQVFAGILCTVDLRNDPIEVYEALLAHEPPRIDLLLPHATWDQQPLRTDDDPACYGRWLGRVYERWIADGRPVPIRLFDSLLSTMAGGQSGTEWVGLDPVDLAVVETDGTWEQVDSLKTAYDGAAYTGLNVFAHAVDEVSAHPGIARRQRGIADLCATCRSCPLVHVCGGGLYAHRYRTGSGFDNPTVYCADVKELVATMNNRPPRYAATPVSDPSGWPDAALIDILDDLASGYAGLATMSYLARSELAITRALVVAVAKRSGPRGPAAAGWALLSRLDRTAAEAVRSVLAHPYTRVWAVRCLNPHPSDADPAHLGNLAAAAAIRANADAEITVSVRNGFVVLPTLGAVDLGGTGAGSAVLSTTAKGFTVRGTSGSVTMRRVDLVTGSASLAWRPSHVLELDSLRVHLEDQDPHRDCHLWSPEEALSGLAVGSWRRSMANALRLIHSEVPGHIMGIHNGLYLITPLAPDLLGHQRSATARDAFGAIAVAFAEESELAVMVVHELQHIKMGAVLDLVDLFDPGYEQRITVGWRTDPRPLEGVMQGTYAHLAVADVWRARSAHVSPGQLRAEELYQQYRGWTAAAIDAMSATGALTPAGRRFVSRMADTVAGWRP